MITDASALATKLLPVIRTYCGYTWEDAEIDRKLTESIIDGVNYLDRLSAGKELTFEDGKPERRLLKDYVFYANAKALDQFVDAYIGELTEFAIDQEVASDEATSATTP